MDHILSEMLDCVLFLLDNEPDCPWRQALEAYLHVLEARVFAGVKEDA